MQERLTWMVVSLASIWLSVALISIFAPDFVSGSEQEHIPLAALITWISGLFATRSVLSELMRRRQPFQAGDTLPYWAVGGFSGNYVFNLADDPQEEHNLTGTPKEQELADRMRQALKDVQAPDDQFTRLGLI
jgi:hypothetical protein